MLIETNRIIVKDRIRKDYGDIEELAKDIKDNGLINPPVVNPSYELIAGERRLRALKYLGYEQIEVRVMSVQDALHQLKLEISENENRKDFTFSEKMKWAEELKNEYSKIAKENQGNRGNTIPYNNRIDSRKKVAKDLDMSCGTLSKSLYVYKNASIELIKQIDDNIISVNKAYNNIKNIHKQRKPIPTQTIKSLIIRSKGKCECCGFGGQGLENILVTHHINKYSNTKDNSLENLIMLCPNCHTIIHTLDNCSDLNIKNNILNNINNKEEIEKLVNKL